MNINLRKLLMKRFDSKLSILIIFVVIFLVLGVTLIYKTLDYEKFTENKFIQKTKAVLNKAASDKNVNEIIEEGGKRFNKLLTTLDIAQNSFALAINSEKKIKMYNKTKAEHSE